MPTRRGPDGKPEKNSGDWQIMHKTRPRQLVTIFLCSCLTPSEVKTAMSVIRQEVKRGGGFWRHARVRRLLPPDLRNISRLLHSKQVCKKHAFVKVRQLVNVTERATLANVIFKSRATSSQPKEGVSKTSDYMTVTICALWNLKGKAKVAIMNHSLRCQP